MRREIGVFLYEKSVKVGRLIHAHEGQREHCTFVYDEAWLQSPDFFELSPSLRKLSGAQPGPPKRSGSIFHDCIADTEPNGWGR
jgi:serine/threonine-protein kinase HipA